MKLVLPYPPSANAYWRMWRGRILVSREARAYKLQVGLLAKKSRLRPLAGPLSVDVDVFRPQARGDLDNVLKCLLDALNGIAWEDDSQVVALHARRRDDRDNPRVEVSVHGVEVREGT